MALTYSNQLQTGVAAPPFHLPGVDGKIYSLESFSDAKALIVIFTCNHCPYAVALEDRIIAIQHDYADRGVRIVAINPNEDEHYPEDSFEMMIARAKEKNFPFPYLRDESQEVAKAYQAACTPDPFVFDEERKLVYNGRIDDNWKEPNNVTQRDMRTVLDCILAKKPIPFEPKPAMGCSIKWKY